MSIKSLATGTIESSADALLDVSHAIHAHPEEAFEEVYAVQTLTDGLKRRGFEVELGVAGLSTAFRARTGSGALQVVICAEYDALPEIGHACGHNIIAASSMGAAIGLAAFTDALDIELVVLGTPAEERGGGKIHLIEAGLFEHAAMAIMVHPAPFDFVDPPVLALHWMEVKYEGRAAHASAFPELGINAADAAVIAQIAIGLARQHLTPDVRVHGIVKEAGTAPNVVPERSTLEYMVRAPHLDQLSPALERVRPCFEAGAVATGSVLAMRDSFPTYAHLEHDAELGVIYLKNATERGRTFHPGPIAPVSTDMGNVSLVTPTLHPFIGIKAGNAVNHQPAFAHAAVGESADQAVIDGAVALAGTVIDVVSDSEHRFSLMERKLRMAEGVLT